MCVELDGHGRQTAAGPGDVTVAQGYAAVELRNPSMAALAVNNFAASARMTITGEAEPSLLGSALRHAYNGQGSPEATEVALNIAVGLAPGFREPIQVPRTGPFKEMRVELQGTGQQANHLNQSAAFRGVIPHEEGLAVGMRGNAFTDIGSEHYEFHAHLEEQLWPPYRRGGSLFGMRPTNAEYGAAVEQALIQAGHSPEVAAILAEEAAAQRSAFGLKPQDPVPNVPGRLPQKKR